MRKKEKTKKKGKILTREKKRQRGPKEVLFQETAQKMIFEKTKKRKKKKNEEK